MTRAGTVPQLLDLLAAAGGRPALTWYGDGGERTELSGAVLANWVTKTTNLLVEELDLTDGGRLRLDLPLHWRSVVWALGTWRAGACVVLPGTDGPADVVVTDRPEAHPSARDLVAVALPALARRFDGDLPDGAVDAAASVLSYGDTLGWVPATTPSSPALESDAGVLATHRTLLADDPAPTAGTARVLLVAGEGAAADQAGLLRTAACVLASGGSLVLLGPAVGREVAADPERRRRLTDQERVTGTL